MKHLKTYRLFESSEDDIDTNVLRDILLEIKDLNWNTKVWQEPNGNYIIIISPKNVEDYNEYEELDEPFSNDESLSVVKLAIQELIDFMKDSGFENYRLTFEFSDFMSEGTEDISIDDIENRDVYSDNFFRLEFWK
jgi:hypothetical protein